MTILCSVDSIDENSAKGIDINGQQLVAVKKDSRIHVYVNSCPHIGIMLEFLPDQFLDLDKQYIQCANHGALFEIHTGKCVAGPCNGQSLKTVPVEISNDQVVITGDIPERYE
ncbi:MAG: (2Fe-2S)-binding protein [Gammaproteobacteria bacterium]|nr:MAG: (2Fe-2S)-binding protein [Gammaproteobacteria bacterium]